MYWRLFIEIFVDGLYTKANVPRDVQVSRYSEIPTMYMYVDLEHQEIAAVFKLT